jgi:hypothetical protein
VALRVTVPLPQREPLTELVGAAGVEAEGVTVTNTATRADMQFV